MSPLLTVLFLSFAVLAPSGEHPASTIAQVDSLWTAGHREEAMERGEAALQEARVVADSSSLGLLLTQRGAQYLSVGRARAAEPLLREGLAIAEDQGDSLLACRARRWLSVAMGFLGRRDEARRLYTELLDCARSLNQAGLQGWARVGMGWDAAETGDNPRAEMNYEKAVHLFREAEEVDGELWALNGLAIARRIHGDLDGAREGYQEVAKRAHEREMPMVEGMALNNLANLEWTVGDPGRAKEGFAKAAAFQLRFGHRREAVIPRINLAHCLAALGDLAAAVDTLQACLAESRELAAPDLEAMTLESLGRVDLQKEQWTHAVMHFREALVRSEGLKVDAIKNSILGLSTALARQDSSAAGLDALHRGLRWCEMDADPVFCARLQLAWGQRLLEQGEFAQSFVHLQEADRIAMRGGIQTLRVAAHTSMAEALDGLDRPRQAISILEDGVKVWEAERGLPVDPDWRSLRGAQGKRLFTDLALAYLRNESPSDASGGAERAFDLLQHYKGRGLLERLRGPTDPSKAEEDLLPVNASLMQSEVLEEGEVFLDVYLGPRNSILLVLDRRRCRARVLPPEEDLKARISILREELSFPRGGLPPQVFDEIAGALSKELFGPVLKELTEFHHVFLSADGVLNSLPSALFESEDGPSWSRIPSAGLLAQLRRKPGVGPKVLPPASGILVLSSGRKLDGRRLRGAEKEVHWLAHRFDGVEEVTELGEMHGREILHVAAHTIADDARPWRSRIILDSGRTLTARNLMEEKVDSRLAVLASCGSAAGKTLSGEGVQSLSTALLAGGTKAVIATLWPVEDEATFSFMRLFYQELAWGNSAAEALHRAQWRFRRSAETSHPFYWAGFILQGESRLHLSLHGRRRGPARWILGAVLLSILIALALEFFRRRG